MQQLCQHFQFSLMLSQVFIIVIIYTHQSSRLLETLIILKHALNGKHNYDSKKKKLHESKIVAEMLHLVVLRCTDVLDKVACECTDMQFYAKHWVPMTIGRI